MNAAADVMTEPASFTKFQQRIDALVHDLETVASRHAPGRDGPAACGHFGGGEGAWGLADALSSAHKKVIGDMEKLSKLLSDSIEGMGLAVLASNKGYESVDADVRDRAARHQRRDYEELGWAVRTSPAQAAGGRRQDGQSSTSWVEASGGETAGGTGGGQRFVR
ncbi:hypothetical protein ABZ622_02370 [Streptomyces sp. NPDC007164]|uniref:hypothetical protein n=1 Tax=Streptomyces sp. NPDC007164 TaxID=3156918 RepID=UPI0033FBAC01